MGPTGVGAGRGRVGQTYRTRAHKDRAGVRVRGSLDPRDLDFYHLETLETFFAPNKRGQFLSQLTGTHPRLIWVRILSRRPPG